MFHCVTLDLSLDIVSELWVKSGLCAAHYAAPGSLRLFLCRAPASELRKRERDEWAEYKGCSQMQL